MEYVFEKVAKHVDSNDIKLYVVFSSLIYRILIIKKRDIVSTKDEFGVPPSHLNVNYKLFAEKHVIDTVLPNIPNINESDVDVGGNVIDVPPISGPVRRRLLKVLTHYPNSVDAFSSQFVVYNAWKEVETLSVDEELTSSDGNVEAEYKTDSDAPFSNMIFLFEKCLFSSFDIFL